MAHINELAAAARDVFSQMETIQQKVRDEIDRSKRLIKTLDEKPKLDK